MSDNGSEQIGSLSDLYDQQTLSGTLQKAKYADIKYADIKYDELCTLTHT